ncbi:MAG: hypothetical protein M3Y87_21690, partial [Myxococcota bacterium]|nr:hypothetical protein [Myxococcota bacterium]
MSDDDEKKPALKPARPDPDELETGRPSYMPRLPWRWIVIFGGLLALVYGGYQLRERQRADALRTQILDTYDDNLSSLSERYVGFRQRLERWTAEAAQAGEPEQWVDPRLRISGLHSGDGIYLRLTAEQAESPERIAEAALAMEQDALVRCLGIAPASARGLYGTGDFLTPDWRDQVTASSDFMRLRVLDEQLARNMEVDVPVVASMLGAEYFLLVVQQGNNRRDAPVDVFLWDLREERQLLRARIRANGILLPVRLRFDGVPQAPRPDGRAELFSGGAHDCSIAAQIKALTGEAPMTIGSGAQLEERMRETDAAAAAAAAEGEEGAAAAPEGDEGAAAPEGAPEGDEGATAPEGAPEA